MWELFLSVWIVCLAHYKDKIKKDSSQLKLYKDTINHLIIIFTKKNSFPIELNNIKYSMFGEHVFRIPIDAKMIGENIDMDF